ncbi:hypothetical protein V1477_005027 [Vespula maculifrons]|uniref:Uncharacterized protein n=1 Tax=Vespula maculifrons TaxID=7453 RepID=A0ABD2CNH0_VESMC
MEERRRIRVGVGGEIGGGGGQWSTLDENEKKGSDKGGPVVIRVQRASRSKVRMAKIVTEGVRASKTHGPEERVESRATNSVNEFEIKGPLLRYASYSSARILDPSQDRFGKSQLIVQARNN